MEESLFFVEKMLKTFKFQAKEEKKLLTGNFLHIRIHVYIINVDNIFHIYPRQNRRRINT